MKEFIFTFGFDHRLKGCFVAIRAENSNVAREEMFRMYGPKWALQYDSREAAGVKRWGLREVPFGTPNGDIE